MPGGSGSLSAVNERAHSARAVPNRHEVNLRYAGHLWTLRQRHGQSQHHRLQVRECSLPHGFELGHSRPWNQRTVRALLTSQGASRHDRPRRVSDPLVSRLADDRKIIVQGNGTFVVAADGSGATMANTTSEDYCTAGGSGVVITSPESGSQGTRPADLLSYDRPTDTTKPRG